MPLILLYKFGRSTKSMRDVRCAVLQDAFFRCGTRLVPLPFGSGALSFQRIR